MSNKIWTDTDIRKHLAELDGPDPNDDDPVAARRTLIIRTATRSFIRYGYRRASMSEIAEKADLAKGTLYQYFTNKRVLFNACIAFEKLPIITRLAEVLKLAPKDQLVTFLQIVFQYAATAPLAATLVKDEENFSAMVSNLIATEFSYDCEINIGLIMTMISYINPFISEEKKFNLSKLLIELLPITTNYSKMAENSPPAEVFCTQLAELLADGVAAKK